jgi:hypothetical protein
MIPSTTFTSAANRLACITELQPSTTSRTIASTRIL